MLTLRGRGAHAALRVWALRRAAWLVPLVLASYGLRFTTSWLALAWASDRRFDPHGFGLLGDGLLSLVLAPVVLGLLGWLLWRRGEWHGLLAPGATPAATALSVVLLVLLGAPLPGQVWAVALLPWSESWPVALSAALWFATASVARALLVTNATRAALDMRS